MAQHEMMVCEVNTIELLPLIKDAQSLNLCKPTC